MSTFEHSYYIGNGLGLILYGVDIAIYYSTMRNLYFAKTSQASAQKMAILSTASLFLLTIDVSTNAIYGEQAWITFRDVVPGGPPAWIVANFSVWYQTLSTSSVAGLVFMSDAFLMYRFYIIWGSRLILVVFPILMYLGGLALAILQIYTSALPGALFFSRKAINFGLPYYTISIALNVILTSGIVGRVIYFERRLSSTLQSESMRVYTGVASILIESAALYSIIGTMMLIPYGLNAPTAVAFAQVWEKLAAIAPQLILMRVSAGTAWSKELVARAESEMEFGNSRASNPITTVRTDFSGGTRVQTLGSKSSKNFGASREQV